MSRFLIFALTVLLMVCLAAGCSKRKGRAPSAADLVPCGYCGMHMKRSAMGAEAKYLDETVYFCTEDEKAAFERAPERYRVPFSSMGYNGYFGALTHDEYAKVMQRMGAAAASDKSHHVFVIMHDRDGQPLAGANLTMDVQDRVIPLAWDEMMKHHTADVDLPSGERVDIGLTLEYGGGRTVAVVSYTAA